MCAEQCLDRPVGEVTLRRAPGGHSVPAPVTGEGKRETSLRLTCTDRVIPPNQPSPSPKLCSHPPHVCDYLKPSKIRVFSHPHVPPLEHNDRILSITLQKHSIQKYFKRLNENLKDKTKNKIQLKILGGSVAEGNYAGRLEPKHSREEMEQKGVEDRLKAAGENPLTVKGTRLSRGDSAGTQIHGSQTPES